MTDLTYSVRLLRRQPRYALTAALTLAAGIGVTAAMFALLDAVYFRPLPVGDADRLLDLRLESDASPFGLFSHQEFLDVQREAPGLADVFAIGQRGITLRRDGESTLLLVHYVSGAYFPSLEIPMHLGRGLAPSDDSFDAAMPQAVINHQLWQDRLGASSDVVGRTIVLNDTAFTVVGVTAPGFAGLNRMVRTDVWIPIRQAHFAVPALRDEIENRQQRWFRIMGRLAPDARLEQARAGLDVLAARWRELDAGTYRDSRLVATPHLEAGREDRAHGLALLGLVGLVLLVACANVVNLTLARMEGRRREVAVRATIGATRGGLVKQLIVESAVLVAAGGTGGLLVASWLVRATKWLVPPGDTFMVLDPRVDARLLAFTLLVGAVATLIVGVVPAVRASRGGIVAALKGDAPLASWSSRRLHARDLLVVGEIALMGIVLVAALLLVRVLASSLSIRPGFDPGKSVTTFYVVPGLKGYDRAGTYRLLEEARRGIAALPGVTRVSYGIRLPAQGNEAGWAAPVQIAGATPPPGRDAFEIRYTMVGPHYFETMGTRILAGRGIADGDQPDGMPVAVISESMARRFWPGESPIGRHIRMGREAPVDRKIVGIAEDIRIGGLYEPPEMYVYVPYSQHPQSFGLLLVESDVTAEALVPLVKRRIAHVDPALPILRVSSFDEHMTRLLYEERRDASIGLAAAGLSLTLGAVGVYGVVSLIAVRRRREVGIRAALGAGRRELLGLLIGRGAVLTVAGVALGAAGGALAGRLLENRLHGIEPADPWSLLLGSAVLAGVALTATAIPAWRAARVDPMTALRSE